MSLGERSIGAVLADIAGNVREMVRAEIRIAKVEASEQVGSAVRGAALAAAGGGVALLAFAFVAIACMYALATVVALWTAALIVAGVVALIGAALMMAGLKYVRGASLAMPKSVAAIKEDIQWAKPSTR